MNFIIIISQALILGCLVGAQLLVYATLSEKLMEAREIYLDKLDGLEELVLRKFNGSIGAAQIMIMPGDFYDMRFRPSEDKDENYMYTILF